MEKKTLSAHLAARLSERVGAALPLSENYVGKRAGISARTVGNYKAMSASGADPNGPSLAKVQRLADAVGVDPLLLLSDLSVAGLALARAFDRFSHDQKEQVYLYLLNVLEGRAVLVLPAARPEPSFAWRPTAEPPAGP